MLEFDGKDERTELVPLLALSEQMEKHIKRLTVRLVLLHTEAFEIPSSHSFQLQLTFALYEAHRNLYYARGAPCRPCRRRSRACQIGRRISVDDQCNCYT